MSDSKMTMGAADDHASLRWNTVGEYMNSCSGPIKCRVQGVGLQGMS